MENPTRGTRLARSGAAGSLGGQCVVLNSFDFS